MQVTDDNYTAGCNTRACNVRALPCWNPSRASMKLREVPLYLKRVHNCTVSYGAVLRWARDGVGARDGSQIYLRVTKFGRWRVVAKADILKFLETW